MGERGLGRLAEQDRDPVAATETGGREGVGEAVRLARDPPEAAPFGASIRTDDDQGVGIRPLAVGNVRSDIVPVRYPPAKAGCKRGMVFCRVQQGCLQVSRDRMLETPQASAQREARADAAPSRPDRGTA
jgi:hypothetical protein